MRFGPFSPCPELVSLSSIEVIDTHRTQRTVHVDQVDLSHAWTPLQDPPRSPLFYSQPLVCGLSVLFSLSPFPTGLKAQLQRLLRKLCHLSDRCRRMGPGLGGQCCRGQLWFLQLPADPCVYRSPSKPQSPKPWSGNSSCCLSYYQGTSSSGGRLHLQQEAKIGSWPLQCDWRTQEGPEGREDSHSAKSSFSKEKASRSFLGLKVFQMMK